MGPFTRSLDHAAQVVLSRTLPGPATPGRPHLYRGPPGRATVIPALLLLFQGCYWYSRAATVIPGLLLVFQGCYCYSRAATGIPGLLLVFQGCTLCLFGDTAPFFQVQAEGGGAVYSHHLLDCRRDGVYSFRLLDFSKPPHLSRPTMKVRFRIFFRAPFG